MIVSGLLKGMHKLGVEKKWKKRTWQSTGKMDGAGRWKANGKQVGTPGPLGQDHRCLLSPGRPLGYLLINVLLRLRRQER